MISRISGSGVCVNLSIKEFVSIDITVYKHTFSSFYPFFVNLFKCGIVEYNIVDYIETNFVTFMNLITANNESTNLS